MREQHPIDELFARALRDAEAAPPAGGWEGIVRERNWAHLTLLRLRRRWGWLALALLLGGTATITGLNGGGDARMAGPPQPEPIAQPVAMAPSALHPAPSLGMEDASVGEVDAERTRTLHPKAMDEARSSASGPVEQTARAPVMEAEPVANGSTHSSASRENRTDGRSYRAHAASVPATPVRVAQAGHVVPDDPEQQLSASIEMIVPTEQPLALADEAATSGREVRHAAGGLAWARPGMLQLRSSILKRELLAADPRVASPMEFRGPRPAWWVAATAGQFRETRTWHGGDAQLANALQGTETPHHTLNFGVLAGVAYRGGWGLATGIEYSAARYDFNHLDQFRSMRDSLVTHVITFNTQVVDSYVDTLTTYTEVRRTVAAVNHYTSIRVPLEGSWHTAWRRWHFGVRGGLALEFNTMRSGVTLMNEQGGTRSVDVSTTEKRTAMLLSGGLAADVGYAINERLALWASPGYATGLFSLSPTDGTPYAVPERLGIRFRLAYTLRPSR